MHKHGKNKLMWHNFQIIQVICVFDQKSICSLIMITIMSFDQSFICITSFSHKMPHMRGLFSPSMIFSSKDHNNFSSCLQHLQHCITWSCIHDVHCIVTKYWLFARFFWCFLLSIDRDPEVDPAFYDSFVSDEQGKHNLIFEPIFPKSLCSFAFHTVQLSFGS